MIFAEMRGKLGDNATNAHERSEDLLTSTVFGLLRYVDSGAGVLRVLRRARRVLLDGRRVRLDRSDDGLIHKDAAAASVEFWPSWKEHGQPDVLVRITRDGGQLLSIVLVEVKLYSPKSGSAGPDAEEVTEEAPPDPDQLVKYWQGLRRRLGVGVEGALLYLTAHASPPTGELGEALRRMPGMSLGWLSWFDVQDEARMMGSEGSLPAGDLAALLAHKGLARFNGFTGLLPAVVPKNGFWRSARDDAPRQAALTVWFGHDAPLVPTVPGFWRST